MTSLLKQSEYLWSNDKFPATYCCCTYILKVVGVLIVNRKDCFKTNKVTV